MTHTELQLPRDDDWGNLGLAYIRASTIVGEPTDKDIELLSEVIAGLRELPEARKVLDSPALQVRLLDHAATFADDVTTTELRIEVHNRLGMEVEVKDIWLDLDSTSLGSITYSSGPVALQAGKQTVTLSCTVGNEAPAAHTRHLFLVLPRSGTHRWQ